MTRPEPGNMYWIQWRRGRTLFYFERWTPRGARLVGWRLVSVRGAPSSRWPELVKRGLPLGWLRAARIRLEALSEAALGARPIWAPPPPAPVLQAGLFGQGPAPVCSRCAQPMILTVEQAPSGRGRTPRKAWGCSCSRRAHEPRGGAAPAEVRPYAATGERPPGADPVRFGTPPPGYIRPDPFQTGTRAPRVRNTDPDTSFDAAAQAKLAGRRREVAAAILELGGRATCAEVVSRTGIPAQTTSRRITDLIQLGLAYDTGTRRLGALGRRQRVVALQDGLEGVIHGPA